jgi:hypothetical protein
MEDGLVVALLLIQKLSLLIKTLVYEHDPFQVIDFAGIVLPIGRRNDGFGIREGLILVELPDGFP